MIKAEKSYYQSLIIENKLSLRKTWGVIKNVINKNKSTKIGNKFKISDSRTIPLIKKKYQIVSIITLSM